MEENKQTRLLIDDKRHLFATLIAMVDRLLFLNKFPVDMYDFALSLLPLDIENAWRVLTENSYERTLQPSRNFWFRCNSCQFVLHEYPTAKHVPAKFFNSTEKWEINENNRFIKPVTEWARRQVRLEDQILRTDKVIKALVHSCNTVGQYQRVSPDLITFLPEKYRNALKDYTKKSPYPAMTVEPEEIDVAVSTLAYAALQPPHVNEEEFARRPSYYRVGQYKLANFPRTSGFSSNNVRRLEL